MTIANRLWFSALFTVLGRERFDRLNLNVRVGEGPRWQIFFVPPIFFLFWCSVVSIVFGILRYSFVMVVPAFSVIILNWAHIALFRLRARD